MPTTLKNLLRVFLASAVALFASAAALAQPSGPDGYPSFSQAELDQVLAPVALYPDSLLSQLLMAATYPRDIAEAAAWSRANPQLRGDEAVRAVDNEPWDPSVKSLVAFPQILSMMDERMEWTERLGDAFMSAPEQVSDTIQVLRGRADQAGNLRSGDEIVVRRDYGNYVIEPAEPEVVYVPYYDPRVVYGRWWWPDYEPVWWSPWAGYSWTPGYSGFGWGLGITLGSGFWYSSFDWPRRYIRFYGHRPHYYRGYSRYHGHRWYSDRDHRRNVRNWTWSGDRRGDGRRWDRDGRRDGRGGWDRDGRWDGRRDGRDGRDGRRDGRGSADRLQAPRSVAPQPAPSASGSYARPIERAQPRSYVAPQPAPSGSESYARPVERAPQRRYVAPQPAPSSESHARPVERVPQRQHVAPQPSHAAPVQHAPAARAAPSQESPVARPARSERSEPARAEPAASEGGARSGGSGRGGRSQQP